MGDENEKSKFFLLGNNDGVGAKLLRIASHIMYGWSLRMCFPASVGGVGEQRRHRVPWGACVQGMGLGRRRQAHPQYPVVYNVGCSDGRYRHRWPRLNTDMGG